MSYNTFNIKVTFKKEVLSTLESTVTQKEQIDLKGQRVSTEDAVNTLNMIFVGVQTPV